MRAIGMPMSTLHAGPGSGGSAAAISSADATRRRSSAVVVPSARATSTPDRSAAARSCSPSPRAPDAPTGPSCAPLMPIARWNSPRVSGEVSSRFTAEEPADSPREGDVAGVAPECRDVALHPLERGDLVSEPVVAARPGRGLGAQLGVGEEPQAPEPVVEGDDDEPGRRELRPAVQRDRRAAELERAEVQPDEHGQTVRGARGRPDVEVEAVLALALVAARVQRVPGRARTGARSGRSRSPRARPSTAPGAAAGGSAAAPPAAPRRGCRGTREPRRRAPASR